VNVITLSPISHPGKKKSILRIPIIFGEKMDALSLNYPKAQKEDQGRFFFKHVQGTAEAFVIFCVG
jgi:hypothetical protein